MDSGVNIANLCPPILEIRLFSNAEDLEIDDLMQRHYDSQHSNPESVLESVSIRNRIRLKFVLFACLQLENIRIDFRIEYQLEIQLFPNRDNRICPCVD